MSEALNFEDATMRILQVIPVFSDSFGGPVTVVRSISKELAKRHDVVVYTTTALDSKHDSDQREEEVNGYRVIYFPRTLKPLCYSYLLGQLNLSIGVMNALKQNLRGFDIVHVHSYQQFPDIIVHHYATKYGVPYILQVHGSLPRIMAKQKLKLIYEVIFGYMLLEDASKVIALSKVEAEQYRSIGVPEEKIALIPNGIDLSKYANLPTRGLFKKMFGIPESKKIILYLGRIHKTKGIDFLIKAYAFLKKVIGYNDVSLVIAGPNDGYLKMIKSLIGNLGMQNEVIFTGVLSEEQKISAYVDSSIVVNVEPNNVFGLVPLEAAACSTPVIVSEGNAISEFVQRAEFGFSVKYGKNNELAETMNKILNDNELLRKMGQRGHKFIFENLGWSNIISKFEEVYEETITSNQVLSKK